MYILIMPELNMLFVCGYSVIVCIEDYRLETAYFLRVVFKQLILLSGTGPLNKLIPCPIETNMTHKVACPSK